MSIAAAVAMTLHRLFAATVLALGLAGCAGTPAAIPIGDGGVVLHGSVEIGERPYRAHWFLPDREPSALVVLEHGFARFCSHLQGMARAFLAAGFAVVCIDAPMAQGNPALAEAMARRLVEIDSPDGRALPRRIIAAGHSAGAAFAATLGATLAAIAPERLAGALLVDPVAAEGFEARLRAVSAGERRPVLALLAPAHRCNAQANALPALLRLRQESIAAGSTGFVGVRLGDGATHVDVEGTDSDWLGGSACGTPLPAHTALVRELAVRWAVAIAAGAPPEPVPVAGASPIE